MKNILLVVVAVIVAIVANSVSVAWANKTTKFNVELVVMCVLSPFVFITFGLVSKQYGLALTSGIVDALITLCSVVAGLVLYKEWDKISAGQVVGLVFALVGVGLVLFFDKRG